jgi:tetratricopeptide (TPR) repeat protein
LLHKIKSLHLSIVKIEDEKTRGDRVILTYCDRNYELQSYDRETQKFYLARHEEAIDNYSRAIEANPNNNIAWYNHACYSAILNRVKIAVASLERAIVLNPKYQEDAKTDSGFDSIRNDSRFQALIFPERF